MLSSLGFDAKNSSRTRNGPSKYLEASRGFSVHVFGGKTPAPAAPIAPPHPYGGSGKFDFAPARPSGISWKPSDHPSLHADPERKVSLTPAPAYRMARPPIYEPSSFDAKHTKTPKSYGIYPSTTSDMYIYERSVSPTSDLLASSPSSSSSDSEIFSESAVSASLEISSTRASSSTETLETSALSIRAHVHNSVSTATPAISRSISSAGPPRATLTDNTTPAPPGLLPPSVPRRPGAAPTFALPLQFSSVETVSDSDSDTVIDDPAMDVLQQPRRSSDPVVSGRGERLGVSPPRAQPPPPPARRNSDERPGIQQVPRARDDQRNAASSSSSAKYRYETPPDPRAPPGLPAASASTTDGADAPSSRRVASNVSVPDTRQAQQPAAVSPSRGGSSSRPGRSSSPPAAAAPPRNGESKVHTAPSRTNSGDGLSSSGPATAGPSFALSAPAMEGSNLTVATRRCVRWSEDLICPSPVLRTDRRKGWFNRRGDQLWTNDGRYKSPEPGKEYPPDLADYPEFNDGWMNEEGIRIDMEHRLIPKAPLRSALKRPKNAPASQ